MSTLVLSRRELEAIWIGDNIRLSIVKITNSHVRLKIEAPVQLSVVREELLLGDDDRKRPE